MKAKCPMKKLSRLPKVLRKKITSKLGIDLDVGCGSNKQPSYVGMDIRKMPGVDIVHDAEVFPWPLPDAICNKILLSHLWEHIKPWHTIDFMNELWRIIKPNGQLLIVTPYAGSFGYFQDPTHCNPTNEATMTYFDPAYPLYGVYKPKPWKIARNAYQMNFNLEIILERRENSDVTEEERRQAVGQQGVPLFDPSFEPYFRKSKKTKNKIGHRHPYNRPYKV